MTVQKPIPCSLYDIRGIQEWLDEMALQGLFLKGVNRRCDRAEFELGDPAPVRYRLDPVGKSAEKDKDREEPYAEMGWTLVCRLAKHFYIFSCGDPQAPELYTDPQSLSIAMDNLVRRELRSHILLALFTLALLPFVLFFPTPAYNFQNLLLWERPQDVFHMVSYPILLILCLPLLAFEFRRVQKIRDTLAQGLPLKAKKRRNRLPWYAIWALFYLPLFALPRLIFPSVGWEVQGLDKAVLSHPWPTTAQLEAVGTSPLEREPVMDGYVRLNSSPFAPVQEEVTRYLILGNSDRLSSTIRYIRASSPRTARCLYQLELDRTSKNLEGRQGPRYGSSRITGLAPFSPRDWPGLDRLEVTQYWTGGHDRWVFAALRDTDVLLVLCTSSARWEDCLPLFLGALNEEVTQ